MSLNQIEIKSSLKFLIWTAILNLLTVILILRLPIPVWAKLILLLFITFSAYSILGYHISQHFHKAILFIEPLNAKTWQLTYRSSEQVLAHIQSSSIITAKFLLLNFRLIVDGQVRSVLIFQQSSECLAFRALIVYLNVSVAPLLSK